MWIAMWIHYTPLFFHHSLLPSLSLTPLIHQATELNDAGSYDEARKYGKRALWCDIGAIITPIVGITLIFVSLIIFIVVIIRVI